MARGGVSLFEPQLTREAAYWLELRPWEEGRVVLVRAPWGGEREDVTPPGFNVRTRVHEYGGGAYLVHGDTVVF